MKIRLPVAGVDSKRDSTLSNTTLGPESVEAVESLRRVPLLSIAAHPNSRRVGESYLARELASNKKLRISRSEPLFGADEEPLRDQHLSRDPLILLMDPGGLRIDARNTGTRVVANGEAVTEVTWIAKDELERGVVLELSDRIVLVLHLAPPGTVLGMRHGILGGSAAVIALFADIERAGKHAAPVLVRGPSGSGKELVARAIHESSARRSGPFVSVNMAAIPPTTAAAELFGHHKGAFTGAASAQSGWFGQAEGGTLFLDEIGETPDAVQPMLLRVLETGEVQPVGGQGVRKVDVRVVAATDADLEAACESGRFRFPLLQRLASHSLKVPPLTARKADLGPLIVHFLERELGEQLARLGSESKPWLAAEVVSRALRYAWPGNVRELMNFTRELVLVSSERARAKVGPTFDPLLPRVARSVSQPEATIERVSEPPALDDAQIVEALRAHRFRVGATARALGISKNTLYQVMERSDGVRKARDLERDEILAASRACGGDVAAMAERLEVSERGLKLRMRELEL